MASGGGGGMAGARTCLQIQTYHPEGRDPFPTQDKAEAYAIGMATQWIDGGKPGFNAEGE